VNIVVVSHNTGNFFFKPDNTLVRDSKDFFPPGFVTDISVALSVVVKISRSSKCTLREYAGRYYNEWGFGLILYPENLLVEKAISMDNTAYVTEKLLPIDKINNIGQLNFLLDNTLVFDNTIGDNFQTEINKSIEDISKYSSLKSGDLIYIEATERIPASIGNRLKVSYSGQTYLDFCIR